MPLMAYCVYTSWHISTATLKASRPRLTWMSQVGRGTWLDTTLHDCKREAVGDSIFSNNPCEMVRLMQIQIGLLQLGVQIVFQDYKYVQFLSLNVLNLFFKLAPYASCPSFDVVIYKQYSMSCNDFYHMRPHFYIVINNQG